MRLSFLIIFVYLILLQAYSLRYVHQNETSVQIKPTPIQIPNNTTKGDQNVTSVSIEPVPIQLSNNQTQNNSKTILNSNTSKNTSDPLIGQAIPVDIQSTTPVIQSVIAKPVSSLPINATNDTLVIIKRIIQNNSEIFIQQPETLGVFQGNLTQNVSNDIKNTTQSNSNTSSTQLNATSNKTANIIDVPNTILSSNSTIPSSNINNLNNSNTTNNPILPINATSISNLRPIVVPDTSYNSNSTAKPSTNTTVVTVPKINTTNVANSTNWTNINNKNDNQEEAVLLSQQELKKLRGPQPTRVLLNPEQGLSLKGQKCLQQCRKIGGISCKKWNDDSITCCHFTGCQWPLYCDPSMRILVNGCQNKL